MPFLALGVEHTTAPLSVRERVTLDADGIAGLSRQLIAEPAVDEVAVLSTCNRTEIYLFADDSDAAAQVTSATLIACDPSVEPYLRTWKDMEAAEHLFRVASGLESQVLGEPQILSQVRETLEQSQRFETIGPNLHSLFRAAISCARQARAGTALGRVNASVGSEAVRAAEGALGSLQGKTVLLIGGGEMSRLVAGELRERQVGTLYVANRTASVALDLAGRYGGKAALLSDVPRLLPQVDLVISATSAAHYVLTPEDFPAEGWSKRVPLHIFDLAMPRDVDPAVDSIDGVVLHDLEALLPSSLLSHWDEDIRVIEGVIAAEIQEFMAWYLTRRVVPVISNLRSHVEAVAEIELKRVAPQLQHLTDRERAAVESLTGRLIDKMFHHLVMRLRLAAQTDSKLVEAAEFFFLHGEGGLFPHALEQTAGEKTDEVHR